jgi:hypothetical protein
MRQREGPQVSSPGPGNIGQGLMQLKTAVDMIQAALPLLPAGSQQHKDALKAVTSLSRHLPQGQPTAGAQQTQLGDVLRQTIRNALMQRIMQRGSGDGGGQPSPSTPLPGA